MNPVHPPLNQGTESTPNTSALAIEASCRWPLLGLYMGAGLWLLLSALAFLIASMSFHSPDMFADCAGFSYGRMAPLASNLLIYGFCVPVAWATCLWILARLGNTELRCGACVMFGGKLWHLGVLVGAVGILAGGATGYDEFEFPVYSVWLLLLGASLVAISGISTLRDRVPAEMHPAQWFAGLAVMWIPWILMTAVAFLLIWPVRGMAQGAVHWWYLSQLKGGFLLLAGIAALFYFVPLLTNRPLAGRPLALFTLITLLMSVGWTGVPLTAPAPAWLLSLSRVMTVWYVVPVLAVAMSLGLGAKVRGIVEARLLRFGFIALLAWTALTVLLSATGIGESLQFTLTSAGLNQLFLIGFSGMIGLGAAYLILPKISGQPLCWQGAVKLQFLLTAGGLLLIIVPFILSGWMQAEKLADPDVAFTDLATTTLMPIRVASMGQLLLVLAGLVFFASVVGVVLKQALSVLKPCCSGWLSTAGQVEGRA